MTERERVITICRELALPEGRWIVNGSGSLVMHGVERTKPMGDLDIFTTTRDWFDLYRRMDTVYGPSGALYGQARWGVFTTDPEDPARCCDPPYLYRTMHGLEVDVFQSWRRRAIGNFDVAFYLANAAIVDGVPCVPLQFILDWKREVGRAKDVDDVRVLTEYLGSAAA